MGVALEKDGRGISLSRKFDERPDPDVGEAPTPAFVRPSVESSSPGTPPEIEIIEETEALIITADVPQVEREDIRVDVSPQRVVITALVRNAFDAISGLFKRDRPFPGFERSISLPAEVRPDSAEAHYNNGVLEVILPKRVLGGEGVYRLPAE